VNRNTVDRLAVKVRGSSFEATVLSSLTPMMVLFAVQQGLVSTRRPTAKKLIKINIFDASMRNLFIERYTL
jgi:hypothetical protein